MPGGNDLPPADLDRHTGELLAEEARLEGAARDMDSRLSGLKDIDLLLALARVKLRLCLAMMKRAEGRGRSSFESLEVPVGRRAASAIRIVESLVSQNVSEDQHGIVQTSPLFAETKRLLEEFLISGGGGFLEPLQLDEHKTRVLSRTVATSIRKFMGEDDRYPPLDIERFPPFLQTLLLTLFPVFIRLRPQKPPYGIEEGEEVTYTSPAMRVPLSQAIHYMENELLPELERRLAADPGHPDLQEEERKIRAQLEQYRSMRVLPRAAPVLPLAKGLHTEGMTGFTLDGEVLVSLPLAVKFRSGTNLDRKMELVRMDVVRRIAGRGVSAEIDREYRHLKSIQSGRRGSSRTPSMKLDPSWGYWVLRQDFPFLSRLSDKDRFQELVQVVRSGSLGDAERFIEAVISRDQGSKQAAALPGP
ncbi:MAG: hypothetical protein ACLQCB_01210 [Spirochaetia bacterium]